MNSFIRKNNAESSFELHGRAVRPFLVGFILMVLLLVDSEALAERFSCDWLRNTESSTILIGGSYGIEVGWSYARNSEDDTTRELNDLPAILARMGFSNRFELRLEWRGYQWDTVDSADGVSRENGMGDGSIGMKIYLYPGDRYVPEVAFLARVPFSTGKQDPLRLEYNPNALFSASKAFGRSMALTYNIGMTSISKREEPFRMNTIIYLNHSLAFLVYTGEWGDTFVELFGDVPASGDDVAHYYWSLGFSLKLRDNIICSFSGGAGINEGDNDLLLKASLATWF